MLYRKPTMGKVITLLRHNKRDELNEIMREMHPIDIAEMLLKLSTPEQVALISRLDKQKTIAVFNELKEEEQAELLGRLQKDFSAFLLNEMSSDDRADLIDSLPDEVAEAFLSLMTDSERRDVEKLLAYPPNSAGSIMATEYVSLKPDITVSDASRLIRQAAPRKETIYYTYVTDADNKLLGFVSLKDIFMADEGSLIGDIMHPDVIKASALQDQEEVARMVRKYDLLVVPVVDAGDRMVGIITVDDVMDVLVEENTEDVLRYGAAGKHIDYMGSSVAGIAKQRILWLSILVVVGIMSGWIMQRYAFQLEAVIALAFFIPLLCDSGGNAGTQSSTVVIRGLATGEINMKDLAHVFRKEFVTGVLVGSGMGALAAIRAIVVNRDPLLGITVGLAMVATVMLATSMGALLPLLFKKLKLDPALMSGPFITSVVDIVSIFIYMQIAVMVFG